MKFSERSECDCRIAMFLSKKQVFSEATKAVDEHILINLLMKFELNNEYEEIQTEIQVRKLRNEKISMACAGAIRESASPG